MTTEFDILALGNAIVDVIARAEDDFLVAQGVAKGSMTLIDEAQAETWLMEDVKRVDILLPVKGLNTAAAGAPPAWVFGRLNIKDSEGRSCFADIKI